jgi:hypothetical protein
MDPVVLKSILVIVPLAEQSFINPQKALHMAEQTHLSKKFGSIDLRLQKGEEKWHHQAIALLKELSAFATTSSDGSIAKMMASLSWKIQKSKLSIERTKKAAEYIKENESL